MKTKKSKFFKAFGFSSLALLMGAAGVFAFAPLGATTPLASANESEMTTTETGGLITPKADDPVIYTTESGIDIKWGNTSNITTLTSGNLAGFPYFITHNYMETYTWVIIGTSSTSLAGGAIDSSYIPFATWITSSRFAIEFNNQYETVTPAGIATNAELATDYLAMMNTLILPSLANLTVNEEIPADCVLCIANDIVATGVSNTSSYVSYYPNSTNHMKYHTTYAGNLVSVMDGYYNNASWGLLDIKESIQSVSLVTNGMAAQSGNSNTWSWSSNTTTNYVFPLAAANSSNFKWSTYLTAEQVVLSENQWCRDGVNSSSYTTVNSGAKSLKYPYKYYINSTGANANAYCNSSLGYRPAFCLKVV